MVVVMLPSATENQRKEVEKEIHKLGRKSSTMYGDDCNVVGIIGDETGIDFEKLSMMEGVDYAHPIQKEVKYPLVSRNIGSNRLLQDRIIEIGDENIGKSYIGGENPIYFIGPCSVESEDQMKEIAELASELNEEKSSQYGIRGGCYKPRTGAHGFEGLKKEGLEILGRIREEFKLPIITEVRSEKTANLVAEISDILQVGARNSYNQDLLFKLGDIGKPVLYKRGFGMNIEDWLRGSGHIIKGGNGKNNGRDIIYCERGETPMGGDEKFLRYPSQMQVGSVLKYETYLPVIFDPSHSAGKSNLIWDSSMGAMSMGYDGLLIEVHPDPKNAITDAKQQIKPKEFRDLVKVCDELYSIGHISSKNRRDKHFEDLGYKFIN